MIWQAALVAVAATPTPTTPVDPLMRPTLSGDATRVGHIDLTATAPAAGFDLRIVEDVNGRTVEVPTKATRRGSEAAVHWTCKRTNRTFRAVSDRRSSDPYIARTPTCEHRLRMVAPETVRWGATLRVKLRDRWQIGNTSAHLCVQSPGEATGCRRVTIPTGQFLANRVLRPKAAGTWVIRADTRYQQLVRSVTVGPRGSAPGSALPTILATGDSLIRKPAAVLRRATAGRAKVTAEVYPSAGLQKPYIVDWSTLPARQVRAYQPDATVLTLGIGDGQPISTPRGELQCCGRRWMAAYARRARRVMRTYAQDGQAAVVWMNIPYPRDTDTAHLVRINQALAMAARGLRRAKVVDIARILTPGRTYRHTLRRNGRSVQVRENDGVHLTREGSMIAVRAIRRALARLGVRT